MVTMGNVYLRIGDVEICLHGRMDWRRTEKYLRRDRDRKQKVTLVRRPWDQDDQETERK